jgi:hypothetical protein
MIETGMEKKVFRSGVEKTMTPILPPRRSARRMPVRAVCWSGK